MKCSSCKQEMTVGVGCTLARYTGDEADRIPHAGDNPCRDCRCPPGTLHHPGCDMERCPNCGGQLISCGCNSPEDEE